MTHDATRPDATQPPLPDPSFLPAADREAIVAGTVLAGVFGNEVERLVADFVRLEAAVEQHANHPDDLYPYVAASGLEAFDAALAAIRAALPSRFD